MLAKATPKFNDLTEAASVLDLWSPWQDLFSMGRFGSIPAYSSATLKDGVYQYTCDLPGYKKDEVEIEVKNEYIEVKAKNESRGSRTLRFTMANDIDVSSLEAFMQDGVLTIKAPPDKTKNRKVTVK